MKKITVISIAALGCISSASGVTLLLTGPGGGTSAPAPGAHVDLYNLPLGAFSGGSPVVSISVTLEGSSFPLAALNFNPGGLDTPIRNPAILGSELDNDTHLLFDLSQIASVTGVVETSDEFSATVNFSQPIDDAPAFAPALRSVNGDHGLTTGEWVFFYANGSNQAFEFGIIPEPTTGALIGFSALAFFSRRTRNSQRSKMTRDDKNAQQDGAQEAPTAPHVL